MIFDKINQPFDTPSSPSLRAERDDFNEVEIRVSNNKKTPHFALNLSC